MNINIGDVAATSFVTLYCHAIESQSRDPILNDPKAVEITHELNKIFFNSNNKLERDFIASSVLNYDWMSVVSKHKGPFLFIAEGVFMYLKREDVKSLVLKLQSEFPGSELVCEVVNSLWLKKPLKRMVNYKMQHRGHLGKDATYNFGVRDSKEMEGWNAGIQFLDDWSYFDSEEKKLGWLKMFRNIELFRKTQWTVHYKLN